MFVASSIRLQSFTEFTSSVENQPISKIELVVYTRLGDMITITWMPEGTVNVNASLNGRQNTPSGWVTDKIVTIHNLVLKKLQSAKADRPQQVQDCFLSIASVLASAKGLQQAAALLVSSTK